ncbi:hypothetical protein D9757_010936 [Collybiopsis confluens]|uniref:Pinin/SDK/MemA protein domain-containing protein n=1 Tax=Collybiopsis confluens TaxID=2823264 RepID=A0A8H5GJY6_9AGAR|nr:hypothetical protein D9757_010936 [Collybiopsis confluens]
MAEETTTVSIPDIPHATDDTSSPTITAPPITRPRLNRGERASRGGKSMFGLVLGTLNKAKIEEKERDASEAAKRRQLLEARLQAKLRNETAEVRKQEEAKRDKTSATRKEEELGVKVSVYRLRRARLPFLANFLLTSDEVPDEPEMDDSDSSLQRKFIFGRLIRLCLGLIPGDQLLVDDPQARAKFLSRSNPPRSHPPPLYYLPKLLLPSQEAFLRKRKEQVTAAATAEWSSFASERNQGVQEIKELREKVATAQVDAPEKDSQSRPSEGTGDVDMETDKDGAPKHSEIERAPATEKNEEAAGAMDVDPKPTQPENEGDDAVEY